MKVWINESFKNEVIFSILHYKQKTKTHTHTHKKKKV